MGQRSLKNIFGSYLTSIGVYVSCRCLLAARTLLDWCCLVLQVRSIISERNSAISGAYKTTQTEKNVKGNEELHLQVHVEDSNFWSGLSHSSGLVSRPLFPSLIQFTGFHTRRHTGIPPPPHQSFSPQKFDNYDVIIVPTGTIGITRIFRRGLHGCLICMYA